MRKNLWVKKTQTYFFNSRIIFDHKKNGKDKEDLYELDSKTKQSREALENEYRNSNLKQNKLLWSLYSIYKSPFLYTIFPRLLFTSIQIFIPFLIKMVIKYMENKNTTNTQWIVLLALFFLLPALRSINLQFYWYMTVKSTFLFLYHLNLSFKNSIKLLIKSDVV